MENKKRIIEKETENGFIPVRMTDLKEGDRFRMFEEPDVPLFEGSIFTALSDGREENGIGIIDVM